jgi:hypothetical protein
MTDESFHVSKFRRINLLDPVLRPEHSIEKLVALNRMQILLAKLKVLYKELDESDYWLEMLVEGKYVKRERLYSLIEETNELIGIFVTIVNKVKAQKTR